MASSTRRLTGHLRCDTQGEALWCHPERRSESDEARDLSILGMPLHCWTSARYVVALPPGHRFPIAKYALLRDAVVASGLVAPSHLHEPARASVDSVRLVHTEHYVGA